MVVGNVPEAVDFLVAGAGPGGYAAALRAAQGGRRVVLVDRDGEAGVGGVCLRVGCIPSKALIEAADLAHRAARAGPMGIDASLAAFDMARFQQWKDGVVAGLSRGVKGLLDRAGVAVWPGTFRFTEPDAGVVATEDGRAKFVTFDRLVLATGSRPRGLAELPFDGARVLDSTAALAMTELPASVAVVGGGYIGLEIGTALAKLGARVSIVEAEDRLLPAMDAVLAAPVARRLAELGVEVTLGARATGLDDEALLVSTADGERRLPAERVVVAVGRQPNTDDLSLESAGLAARNDGLLEVGPDRRVDRRIAAIGDIVPGPALAHKATAEAEVAVDALEGRPAAFEPAAIPAVVFSDPEVASAGLGLAQAKDAGIDADAATMPLAASGRAATVGAGRHGFALVVYDRADGTVLGVHAVAPHASDVIAEGVLAIEMGCTLEDLALTVHPHPTFSEPFHEAALLGLGRPLHVALSRRDGA